MLRFLSIGGFLILYLSHYGEKEQYIDVARFSKK